MSMEIAILKITFSIFRVISEADSHKYSVLHIIYLEFIYVYICVRNARVAVYKYVYIIYKNCVYL